MKKRILVLGLSVGAFSLTGCGAGAGSSSDYEQISKLQNSQCSLDKSDRFVYEDIDTLTDTLTCLKWRAFPQYGVVSYVTEENFKKGRYDDTSGLTAKSICEAAGDGWRLPTKYEALSAIIDTEADLSKMPYRGKIPNEIYNKGEFFTSSTWTSTPVSGHAEYRWYVEFLDNSAETNSCRVNAAVLKSFCVKKLN